MARKKRRQRPAPDIEIIETLQPAPETFDFGTSKNPKPWYLVYTTAKGEERAAGALKAAGCQVFWPHLERVIRRKNKPEVKNLVSTFPRYLFAEGLPSLARRMTIVGPDGHSGVTIDGRPVDDIRELDGVVCVISNHLGWCKVPRQAIMKVAEYQGTFARPVPAREQKIIKALEPGARVTIIDGPFMGFHATVVDSIGLEVARVLIDIFGRETPAEFELAQIEAA